MPWVLATSTYNLLYIITKQLHNQICIFCGWYLMHLMEYMNNPLIQQNYSLIIITYLFVMSSLWAKWQFQNGYVNKTRESLREMWWLTGKMVSSTSPAPSLTALSFAYSVHAAICRMQKRLKNAQRKFHSTGTQEFKKKKENKNGFRKCTQLREIDQQLHNNMSMSIQFIFRDAQNGLCSVETKLMMAHYVQWDANIFSPIHNHRNSQ